MSLQHKPPKSHQHRCFQGCNQTYDCQKPECRKLKWHGVCPKCYLEAKNYFNEARAYLHPPINPPEEEEIKKGHKREFNPRPKQPTLHKNK